MVVIGLLIMLAGLAAFGWICTTLAAFALPVLGGLTVGRLAWQAGLRWEAATALGLFTALFILAAAQLTMDLIKSPWLRAMVVVLFATPAAWAAWSLALGVADAFHITGLCRSGLATAFAATVAASVPGRLATTASHEVTP